MRRIYALELPGPTTRFLVERLSLRLTLGADGRPVEVDTASFARLRNPLLGPGVTDDRETISGVLSGFGTVRLTRPHARGTTSSLAGL